MGLLSKASTLLKENQAGKSTTKKLTTSTINPTASKSNMSSNSVNATTISPMTTANVKRTATVNRPTRVVTNPTTIKLPNQPVTEVANPKPVVKPATTTNTIKVEKKIEPTKQSFQTTKTVAQTTPQPTTQAAPTTKTTITETKQTTNQLRRPQIVTMDSFSNLANLNPNRHRNGFIAVTHDPVHPQRQAASAQARINHAGGNYQGNLTNRTAMNQAALNGQPNVMKTNQSVRPSMTQNTATRPNTMSQTTTSRPATIAQQTSVAGSYNNTGHPVMPQSNAPRPNGNQRATYGSRPNATIMTNPNSSIRPATATRPAMPTRKPKAKRVTHKKRNPLKICKLVSTAALAMFLTFGSIVFINNVESEIYKPHKVDLSKYFPDKTELVAKAEAKMKENRAKINANANLKQNQSQTTVVTVAAPKVAENKAKIAPTQAKPATTNKATTTTITPTPTATKQVTNNNNVKHPAPKFQFTQRDREVLAKMIYGEAGYGTDPFEVTHVALNRLASGLFGKTLTEVITAKRQFAGFNENHPIDKNCLAIGNQAIDDFIANGCKPFCKYIYFHTHQKKGLAKKYNRNVFKEGLWWEAPILPDLPGYSEEYCPTALQQAERYYAQRKLQQTEYHYTQHEVKAELELTARDYTQFKQAVHNHTQHQKANTTEIAMNR